MIFATILTICTAVSTPCNYYIIDTATSSQESVQNKIVQASDMRKVWGDDTLLQAHLAKFNIVERVSDIELYEVRNEIIQDDMIP